MDPQYQRLSFLKARGFQPRQVLDIGAHKGHWARMFQSIFPEAKLFLFEADPRHDQTLRATGLPYRIGLLGRFNGTIEFHTLDDADISTGASMFRENTSLYDERGLTLDLPMSRLDDITAGMGINDVNFIKLDVQGAELEVLAGATGLLAANTVDMILAELSLIRYNKGAPLADAVITYMRTIGFGIHDIVELHYWNDQLCQMDVLFAREGLFTSDILVER